MTHEEPRHTSKGEQLPATNIKGDETLVRATAGEAPGEYPLADPPRASDEAPAVSKAEMLAAIARERADWEALLAAIGEERMEQPGFAGDWTFKDVAAHLSGWRQRTLERLDAAARGAPEPPPPWPAELTESETDDEINEWIYAKNRDRPLADTLEESRNSYQRLADAIASFTEEELNDPHRFAWMDGTAMGPALVDGALFDHLHEEHEPGIRRWLAENAR
jgi:hypothetical protein